MINRISTEQFDDLLDQRVNESVILTLNKLNYSHAIPTNMISSLLSKLLTYVQQNETNMIIIKGQDNEALAAEEPKSEIYNDISDQIATRRFHQAMDDLYRVTYELSTMKTPTIAIMDGQTIGFDSGIAFCSKIRIATESTVMMMPETTMGHFTDSSTSYFLSRLKNNYGRYLALCAAPMNVEDIMIAGIATHYVPSRKIPSMIECLTQLKSPSLKELDATINLFTERWPINSLSCTMDVSKDRAMQTIIKECFKYNTIEEILVALENEGSAFAMKARDDMLKASPTALKITLELLSQASNLSFIDSIILERRLWNLDVLSHDFKEGHKAVMNKKAPEWHPKSLRDVDLEKNIKHDRFQAANALKPLYLRHIEHATFRGDKHIDAFDVFGSDYEVIYKCSL